MGLFEEQVMDVLCSTGAFALGDINAQFCEQSAVEGHESCSLSDLSNDDFVEVHADKFPNKARNIMSEKVDQGDIVRMISAGSTASCSQSDMDSAEPKRAPTKKRQRANLQPIPEQKQFKNWKNATPSKYCHSCGSVPRTQQVACKNLETGTCRKMFCQPCIEKIYGHFGPEHMDGDWECTHCAGACPEKASCRYYSKRNSMRRNKARKVAQA